MAMTMYVLNNVYTVRAMDTEAIYWYTSGLYCRTHFSE